MRERIEKESGVKLKDFPQSDFDAVEKLLNDNEKIEVWLLRGMGRYYIKGFLPNKNDSHLPRQEKLCDLTPLLANN